MCLDGDWVVGIFVLNALEIVSHAAKELLEADRRVALQVDEDEAFPDLGRDRREAALRLVEPLERSLVGHADQPPVRAVGPVVIATDQPRGIAGPFPRNLVRAVRADVVRTEEHTSDLQSLMRIYYAVFCTQKK